MINLEALKANLADVHGVVISDNAWLKALLDENITPDDPYDSEAEKKGVDLATIRIYKHILGSANMNEGGLAYSITNKEYIQNTIDSLLIRWGLPPEFKTKATVQGVSPW
jgi:hypothetical protein